MRFFRALAAAVAIVCAAPAAVLGAEEPAFFAEIAASCGPRLDVDARDGASAARAAVEAGALRILVIGSSSTAGVGASRRSLGYPALVETALRASLDGVDVLLEARGVGGEKAPAALARLRAALAEETPPDLVVWQIGTNDALGRGAIRVTLDALIDGVAAVRDVGADIVVIDPQHLAIRDRARRMRYIAFTAAIGEVARRLDVPLVPRFERMRSSTRRGARLLARDRLHMNDLGHACLGRDVWSVVAASIAR